MSSFRVTFSITLFVAALLAAAAPVGAQGATVFVSAANATGVEDGTAASPFNTIQEGIDAAVAGDTVLVAPGVYVGAIELKTGVPLVSEKGPQVTIIDGTDAYIVVNAPYDIDVRLSIDGFTVKGGNLQFHLTNRVNFWSGSTLYIRNCVLDGAATMAVHSYPASQIFVTNTVISHTNWAASGIWCGTLTLTNVTVDGAKIGVDMYQTSAALTNTTFSNVEAVLATSGYYGSAYYFGTNNNVFAYGSLLGAGNAGQVPYLALTNTMEVDPQFVVPDADYHLSPGSPLVDAGVDVGLPFTGAAPDIGAYEADASIESLVGSLATSVASIPVGGFKNEGEQRRNALENKVMAVVHKLATILPTSTKAETMLVLADVLDKLTSDISAKADGFFGGNPKNDWLVTQEEQARLRARILPLIDAVQAEIARLGATP